MINYIINHSAKDTPDSSTLNGYEWLHQRNVLFHDEIVEAGMHFYLLHGCVGDAEESQIGIGKHSYIVLWELEVLQRQAKFLDNSHNDIPITLIFGHTHLPFLAGRSRLQNSWEILPIHYDKTYPLTSYDHYLINPGSTGLPRNRLDNRPVIDYAIIEMDSKLNQTSLSFRRTLCSKTYQKTIAEMQLKNYPNEIINYVIKTNKTQWSDFYAELAYEQSSKPKGWMPKLQKITW